MEKICNGCGIPKDETEFSWYDKAHTKRSNECRPCSAARARDWYNANAARKIKSTPSAEARARYKRRKWAKLTNTNPDELEARWLAHNKHCDACGRSTDLCLDHDHTTLRFRGWLCNGCNLALGHVQDDPARLQRLIEYLERKD